MTRVRLDIMHKMWKNVHIPFKFLKIDTPLTPFTANCDSAASHIALPMLASVLSGYLTSLNVYRFRLSTVTPGCSQIPR